MLSRFWYVSNGYGDQRIENYEDADSFNVEAVERDVIVGWVLR